MSDWEDSTIEWIFNRELFSNFSYKNTKRKINSLEDLRIQDNSNFMNLSQKNDAAKTPVYLLILFLLYPIFDNCIKIVINNNSSWAILYSIILMFFAIVLLCLFLRVFASLISCLINKCAILSVLRKTSTLVILNILTFSFLFSGYIQALLTSYHTRALCVNDFGEYLFWISILTVISSILIFIIFRYTIKYLSIFQLENSNTISIAILALLSMSTRILNINWEKSPFWMLFIIFLTISSTVLKPIINHEQKKRQQTAQKIFEEQLLSNNPDYEELKKCYYHGGKKYKEKLLSNEKFLNIIVESELCSFNDVKTYEDYRLYKAFNYKNYLESQK